MSKYVERIFINISRVYVYILYIILVLLKKTIDNENLKNDYTNYNLKPHWNIFDYCNSVVLVYIKVMI